MRITSRLTLRTRTVEVLASIAFALIGFVPSAASLAEQAEFSNTFDLANDPAFRDCVSRNASVGHPTSNFQR